MSPSKRRVPDDILEDDILDQWAARNTFPLLELDHGMTLTHRMSGAKGVVVGFTERQRLVLEDASGARTEYTPHDGHFAHEGVAVALREGSLGTTPQRKITASGSFSAGPVRARVARASRIWVEGIHDAELIEKIWGDDLRIEGIVVEPLHGADDLVELVRRFDPGPTRRLGVLLDHLVDGSKESRIAAAVTNREVLICGHPYVDIWQAISPRTIGIDQWPVVPHGRPWKEGVLEALGFDPTAVEGATGRFWQGVLAKVTSYRDVETPLVNAVEQLIDFVTFDGGAD